MHEISIAEDLAKIVMDAASKAGLSEVSSINISFGQLIQIVPEIFKFAFREIVNGTIAGHAEVNIEIVPVKLKCRKCEIEFDTGENYFVCQNCNSFDVEIINGKELFVKSIEGE